MASRIAFTGKQEVNLEDFTPPEVGEGQIRVKTHYSLMSTGTENIVFNHLFSEGTHWDRWVKYPFYPGYAAVGEVLEVGAGIEHIQIGDRVACRSGHGSENVVDESRVYPIPDGVDLETAPWFALGKIAFMGAKAVGHFPGDTVLVIGAGPIGQMALRWAVASGAETAMCCDMIPWRLEMARKGGATAVFDRPVSECAEEIKAANNGDLPYTVIDTTGNAKVFPQALAIAARLGRVCILGDTGSPEEQRLTSDVITRGIRIIGAHDAHNDEPWNPHRVIRLFFNQVARDRFPLDGLNSHVFQPAQCREAYAAANAKRGETMGIVFDWTQENS